MELISLSCNNCGAPLEVPISAKFVTCSFCKSRLAIHSTENAYYTEVLGEIDRKTSAILSKVDTLIDFQSDPGKWETCEIEWERSDTGIPFSRPNYWFTAYAIDPNGSYEAATIGPFKAEIETVEGYDSPVAEGATMIAFKQLLSQLSQDGWEPAPQTSTDWYRRHFRRRFGLAKGPQWEWCTIEWRNGPEQDKPEGTFVFVAKAEGDSAREVIATSQPITNDFQQKGGLRIPNDTYAARSALNGLLDSLTGASWLLNNQGDYWYNWSLRKRMNQ